MIEKERDLSSYQDILTDRRKGSDFMWISRELSPTKAYNQWRKACDPARLQREVFNSSKVQQVIYQVSANEGMVKEEVARKVKDILREIGHDRKLPTVRWIGLFLIKILKKTLAGLYVNEQHLLELKAGMGLNPVLFVPSHRSYADFILMAYVCFHYGIEVPCVAAGMDFYSMWLVGRLLRDCSAFFMRRTFNSDILYRTVFEEYIRQLVVGGDAPIEFFIEGTRSRASKSLMPKFGLLSMVLDPLLSGDVPDITIVPVSISYDRVLEEKLFAYEMLGVPKPKESTSGLIKGLNMLGEQYGNVYVDFCTPISARDMCCSADSGIVHLAHTIVHRQEANTVLSCFNILALVVSNHLMVDSSECQLHLEAAASDVTWLFSIFSELGALVDKRGSTDTVSLLRDSINVHKSLVALSSSDTIHLVSIHTLDNSLDSSKLKGHRLAYETMAVAVPVLMLQEYVNPCLHYLIGPALVTVAMQHLSDTAHIDKANLFRKYKFLRSVLAQEFVFYKKWEYKEFDDALSQLEALNIVERHGDSLYLGNHRKLQLLFCNLLYPFLAAHLAVANLFEQLDYTEASEGELMQSYQQNVEQALLNGDVSHHYILVLDLLSSAVTSLVNMKALHRIKRDGTMKLQYNADVLPYVIEELESLVVSPRGNTEPLKLSSKHLWVSSLRRTKL